jgi:DNA mismatch endonuclease, patch repair protein
MADILSKEERSNLMRKVKSKNNRSTEIRLVELFKEFKIAGWRRNFHLFGRPDFVFPNKKVAVFVDGCFWHGHDCRNTQPSSNQDFWNKKFAWNRARDSKVNLTLRKNGWKVIRIWECSLKKQPTRAVNRVRRKLTGVEINASVSY